METLALLGGTPIRSTPFPKGQRFGAEELEQLREALEQGTLFYWSGNKVKAFTRKFAEMYGKKHCVATSSGTAALHVALGAVGVTEGDEVIVSPITDMGSLVGILFQNAIPVFADLDPHTYNMTAASIEACITDKTRAIMVVHLAGNPSDMDAIMEVARRHNVKVVEDCAQSYLSYAKGRLSGTQGDIGCFSLNEFKHISTGDGGMLITDDDTLFERAARFADKNYNRHATTVAEMRAVPYLAPNYRMTELQGAVAIAQLDRLPGICAIHTHHGDRITNGIQNLPGIHPHKVRAGDVCSYWFYMLRLNEKLAGVDAVTFADALIAEGIPSQQGYIPSCVYGYDMFQNLSAYQGTHAPFDSKYYGRPVSYPPGLCPNAEEILRTAVKININQFYTDSDINDIIAAVNKVAGWYAANPQA